MSVLSHADLFHTGIVVDDLAAAKKEFSALLGVAWLDGEREGPMLLEDGPRTVKIIRAYSAEGPHHLELIQSVAGTIWTAPRGGATHHLGYWSDDVAAATAALAALGLPRVVNIGTHEEDRFPTGVYHRARNGLYIEVLARSLQRVIFGDGQR